MNRQVRLLIGICMTLLFGPVLCSHTSFENPAAEVITTTVKYDYYVVAGYEMEPTPPSPAPSWVSPGFNFSCDPPVYNFGNITKWGGRDYLKWGTMDEPTIGSAYVTVNITNLLGYDITVINLTVQITAGTPTKRWWFPPAGEWFGNYTLVHVDTLDPWDPEAPVDEVDYTTGEVKVWATPDGDWLAMDVGPPYPEPVDGLRSLLEPDYEGDAAATGHVAPVQLAAGETLTEYFGVTIFGDVDPGTQIEATITLALTYKFEVPAGYPVPLFTYEPTKPVVGEVVTFDASASTSDGGTIETYTWDFGDGTKGTGVIVDHAYAPYTTPRTYIVILNVTDSEGRWTTASEFITVSAPAPAPLLLRLGFRRFGFGLWQASWLL